MSKESGVLICPNPKCQRKIEKPILLNNLSTTPVERYYACPHCLIKLDADDENDKKTTQEPESKPNLSLHPMLEKVRDAISNNSHKEEEKKTKGEKKKESKKEEPSAKQPQPSDKEETGPLECTHDFGYLAHRDKNAPIPKECLICPKIVDCMLKLNDSE